MRALEANGIVPESLAESIPKLEDVFISFTTGERIGDSAGGNASKDARSDSKANAAREGENDD